MKIMISYFYQIRFFKPNMIPVSTAVWDPRWFHEFKDKDHIFKDKNGVYNGLRADKLLFKSCMDLCRGPEECRKKYGKVSPDTCQFLSEYKSQLDKLDFDKFIKDLESTAMAIKIKENFKEDPIIVLIVYEAPNNPCSERVMLKKWFEEHGIELTEFVK